ELLLGEGFHRDCNEYVLLSDHRDLGCRHLPDQGLATGCRSDNKQVVATVEDSCSDCSFLNRRKVLKIPFPRDNELPGSPELAYLHCAIPVCTTTLRDKRLGQALDPFFR